MTADLTREQLERSVALQRARNDVDTGDVTMPVSLYIKLCDMALRSLDAPPSAIGDTESRQRMLWKIACVILQSESVIDGQRAIGVKTAEKVMELYAAPQSASPEEQEKFLAERHEQECKDGDRLCEALGVSRTEGGWLNVPKMLAAIRDLKNG